MAKVKVRFNETRTVQDGSGDTFEKGKSYELPEDSAAHWLSRGVAVEDKGQKQQQKPAAKEGAEAKKGE